MNQTSRTAAEHLQICIHHWRDLRDALGGRSAPAWPPAGRMTDYLRALDQADAEQLEYERHRALALRTLERDPAQIGERPIPIRLPIHETMRIVTAALVECADQIAASLARDGFTPAEIANMAGPDFQPEPIRLRWGLDDVEYGDDDTVTLLLSGPDGEPYLLELEPERVAVLRQNLVGPDA
jgi:hypothetical protein